MDFIDAPPDLGLPTLSSETSLLVVGSEVVQQLQELHAFEDVRQARSVQEAVDLVNTHRISILVIDVTGPPEAVLSECSRLRRCPAVVFLCNDPMFAQRALEMGAVDCLTKPASPIRMARALHRAQLWSKARLGPATPVAESANASDVLLASRWLRMVRNGVLVVAAIDDVVYFQAERKLTRVVLANTDGYLHMGISSVASKLDSRMFWRIHRSTIVNGRFVGVVQRDDLGRLMVRMHGRTEVLYVSKANDALGRDGIF
jgi:DNA-binding LytR/AlgR family response regulator